MTLGLFADGALKIPENGFIPIYFLRLILL